ncbi:MAG TPA: NAD(P)/FAD-dependent oxidoreductase [Solirubrobacteraceae bacterium]
MAAGTSEEPSRARVAIIGSGISGLTVAMALAKAGIEDVVLLEKESAVGGTWRDNTYPGCACDVPTQLYSFGFAPKSDWSRAYAGQEEIRAYIEETAERLGVSERVRTNTEVEKAQWDEEAQEWELLTSTGTLRAPILVSATGPWNEPVIPELPGMERFSGHMFHSARWDHDHNLEGRRVAVIGTGASAVQFVPEIQPKVAHLHVFQRTAHWVLPKPDRAITALEAGLLRRFPALRRALRAALYYAFELVGAGTRHVGAMRQVERLGRRHLRRSVRDVQLRRALTPSYTLGCKRMLMSNEWYPALQAQNVEVLKSAVQEIRERSVVAADGSEREVDTIIFGTGFRMTDLPIAQRTFDREGRSLAEVWSGSPRAYLGTTIAGFPNFFMMLGPNCGNGHGSAFTLVEAQARYVLEAVRAMDARGLASVEVRAEVQERFNEQVQQALQSTVWNAGGCSSYYMDKNGHNAAIFPWSTIEYRRRTGRFEAGEYTVRARQPSYSPDGGKIGI